nr:hypothetical protein [uncultured Desulfobacter sp.]
MEKVDPKIYGLPSRTVLESNGKDQFHLVINRKSRIIMKDAQAILKKAETIRKKEPNAIISLKATAPVCSKSIQFLKENGILVRSAASG